MRLANRKLYGIETTSLDGRTNQFYLNFGEGRYGYISYENFFKYVKTWKGQIGTKWVNIVSNGKIFNGTFGFCGVAGQLFELMSRGDFEINKKVALLKEGSFLMELEEYIPYRDGKITQRKIKQFYNYTIKYNLNGIYGFSIWKNKICLEDRIWSISKCEEIIKEIK